MKRYFLIFALLIVTTTNNYALETTYSLTVNTDETSSYKKERLIATANFNDVNLIKQNKDFSVFYLLRDATTHSVVFKGSAKISANDFAVKEGDIDTGEIAMYYDPSSKNISTNLLIMVPKGTYDVVINTHDFIK